MAEYTFLVGSKVALKSAAEGVYTQAFVGSQGWVRDCRYDRYGYEMIYVEWDEDHWRYNEQPNGWTFAKHFEFIEMEAEVPLLKLPDTKQIDPAIEEYVEVLTEGMKAASEAEGFVLFVAKKIYDGESHHTALMPTVFSWAHSAEAEAALSMAMADNIASIVQEATLNLLELLEDNAAREEDAS